MQQTASAVLPCEQAVLHYGAMVVRTAYSFVKNQYDAEDIAQEVFVSLLKANPAFATAEHQKAWLIRCTINRCKTQFRSAWHRRTTALDEALSVPFTPQESTVLQAVQALPQKYRTVLYLYYIEGYSTPELAALLHRKQNTIVSQLARGRALLKNALQEDFAL